MSDGGGAPRFILRRAAEHNAAPGRAGRLDRTRGRALYVRARRLHPPQRQRRCCGGRVGGGLRGRVAEWLCRGLQIPVGRFDSGPGLHNFKDLLATHPNRWFCVRVMSAKSLFAALGNLWKRRPKTTNVLAVATIMLAVFAGLAYCATIDNLKRTQRAWLAPIGADMAGPVEVGRALRVNILYENVGKEPALDVTRAVPQWGTFPIPPNIHGEAWLPSVPAIKNDSCDGLTPRSGRETVYPSSSREAYKSLIYVFNAEPHPFVTENFINMKETFFVFGCFAYRTFNEVHKSAFCLYVQPTPDDRPEYWTFRFCPTGNHAN